MQKLYGLLLLLLLSLSSANAQSVIKVRVVKDSLFIPWEIIWGPDNNIWLTQKNGYICRLHPASGVLDTLYHETATIIQSEGGMLGMALHPQFASNPYVYAVYNYLQGATYRERVVRYTYDGSAALSAPLILVDNINAAVNHNGSRLLIVGDKLFFTAGDALTMSDAQSLSSPNGKVHRINLDGSIPADNPMPGSSIWSWGHRNPQGLVYANGILYSSEHGNTTDDEVNIIRKGRNYGWPAVEGFCDKPAEMQFCADSNVVQPLFIWTPTIAPCGIDYYNAPMFPAWQGSLIMASLKDAHLYTLKLNTAKDSILSATVISQVAAGRLRDVCISPEGRIYISTSNSNAAGTGAKTDRILELYDSGFVLPPPAGIALQQGRQSSLHIYPNPVEDALAGDYSGIGDGRYRIFSVDGRCVQEGAMQAGSFRIPVAALAPGSYVMVVSSAADGAKAIRSFIRK